MPNLSLTQSDNENLTKDIVSALLFYKILNVPCLTVFEIYRYLNKTQNSSAAADKTQKKINLSEIINTLGNIQSITSQNGFYWLIENSEQLAISSQQYENRILAAKISAGKIKKAKKISRFLKIIPFVKSIAISGSVSMNAAKSKSDIDIFIISKKNRIWLARMATVFFTQVIGQRRHKNIIKDKICLNIYIADEQTEYPVKNLANSQMIARSLPIYSPEIFSSFLFANKNWIGHFMENFEKNFLINKYSRIRQIGGQTINYKLMDFIENLLGKMLAKRISRNSPDAKPPFLVINNNALLFHYPRSKNAEVMEKYEKILALYENKN